MGKLLYMASFNRRQSMIGVNIECHLSNLETNALDTLDLR